MTATWTLWWVGISKCAYAAAVHWTWHNRAGQIFKEVQIFPPYQCVFAAHWPWLTSVRQPPWWYWFPHNHPQCACVCVFQTIISMCMCVCVSQRTQVVMRELGKPFGTSRRIPPAGLWFLAVYCFAINELSSPKTVDVTMFVSRTLELFPPSPE